MDLNEEEKGRLERRVKEMEEMLRQRGKDVQRLEQLVN